MSESQDEQPFNTTKSLPRTPPQRADKPTASGKHQAIILGTPWSPPDKEDDRNVKANMEDFLNGLSPPPLPCFGTLTRNLMATIEEYINETIQGIQDIQAKAGDDDKKTTVTIQRQDINAIKQNLIQAKEAVKEHINKQQQQQQQQQDNRDLEYRTNTMETDIREIKEAIKTMMSTKAKTWAKVVAGGNKEDTRVEMAKKESLEKARGTRAKTEVTLTFQNATQETKDSLQSSTDPQVQSAITRYIHEKTDLTAIQLRGIQQPTKLTVKLLCQTGLLIGQNGSGFDLFLTRHPTYVGRESGTSPIRPTASQVQFKDYPTYPDSGILVLPI
jgi:hypothetical protein